MHCCVYRLTRLNKNHVIYGRESVSRIFRLADNVRHSDIDLSRRYVKTGEMVAKRLDITLDRKIKRSYCKKCKSIYGADTRIRIQSHLVLVRCPYCGDVRRFPII